MGPVSTKVPQKKQDDLQAIFAAAVSKVGLIITAAAAARIRSRAAIQAKVRVVTTQLNKDVGDWVAANMPGYYYSGANDVLQALRKADAVISAPKGNPAVDKSALQAIVDQTTNAMTDATAGIARSASNIVSDAVRQQANQIVAQGRLNSEALKTVQDNIQQSLKDNGVSALKDKAGRTWQPDVYARNVARTQATALRNEGVTNRMLANGFDLVQVSNTGSDHPVCEEWEDEIISISGNTDGYPTLDDAKSDGLFHPNCEHNLNPLDPSDYPDYYDNPGDFAAAAATLDSDDE